MTGLRQAFVDHVDDQNRVDTYYLPAAGWVEKALRANLERPCFLGISGPQGGGKSTLAAALAFAFSANGHKSISLSIGDFYLPFSERIALAEAHPGNPLFEVRGFAGTHDIELGAPPTPTWTPTSSSPASAPWSSHPAST